MTDPAHAELGREAMRFLDAHAKLSADFDPDFDDPGERYNGPDPVTVRAAAEALIEGREPPPVQSSWESGCYRPYGDTAAREWHDGLTRRIFEAASVPTATGRSRSR